LSRSKDRNAKATEISAYQVEDKAISKGSSMWFLHTKVMVYKMLYRLSEKLEKIFFI